MLQNRLDDKIAILIIDEHLDRFLGDTNEVFLPLALSLSDTVFGNLAAMLVASNLSKVLDDGFVDDRTALIGPQKHETLSDNMVASDVAAEIKYAPIP